MAWVWLGEVEAWRGDQQSKVEAKRVDGRARWLTRRVGGIACGALGRGDRRGEAEV